jgi:hypothetical protein
LPENSAFSHFVKDKDSRHFAEFEEENVYEEIKNVNKKVK